LGAFYVASPINHDDKRTVSYGDVQGAMYQGAVFPNIIQLLERSDYSKGTPAVLHELAHATIPMDSG
jgi:hypothetical protein